MADTDIRIVNIFKIKYTLSAKSFDKKFLKELIILKIDFQRLILITMEDDTKWL